LKKQPLHDSCDDLYTVQTYIEQARDTLRSTGNVIIVYEELERALVKIETPLMRFRNKALKDEGERDV